MTIRLRKPFAKQDAVGATLLLLRFAILHDGYINVWQLVKEARWHQNSLCHYADLLVTAGVLYDVGRKLGKETHLTYSLTPKSRSLLLRFNRTDGQRSEQSYETVQGLLGGECFPHVEEFSDSKSFAFNITLAGNSSFEEKQNGTPET